jgi:PII-like signaling protein
MNEDCLKLTAYFAERDRVGQQFLGDALLAICERHAFQASVMLRGAEGFGPHHVLQTDRLLSLSEDLPAVLTAVGTRARIEKALPDIIAIDNHGLVTLERARMLTGSVRGVALPEELHDATKLTIYCGRHERVRGRPATSPSSTSSAVAEHSAPPSYSGSTAPHTGPGNGHDSSPATNTCP